MPFLPPVTGEPDPDPYPPSVTPARSWHRGHTGEGAPT